jgi:hypothetical protein
VLIDMKPVSQKELEEQAAAFADDRIAFLEQQNKESKHQPLVAPKDRRPFLQIMYRRFVARYREVTPK